MKNNKTKIILLAIIFLSVFSFFGTVEAASSSLYVSPASITKTAGDIFNASVGFNASGNKVCAAEGTLVFNNISCQSITVADGVMAQSTPSCSNPHFLIGIPNCSTSDKVLFTVSVKAGSAGPASISLTSVDVIGEGASVGSVSINGNYTVNAVPISTTPQVNTETTTPKTTKQAIQPTKQTTQKTEVPIQQTTPENNLVASAVAADLATGSNWFNYFAIALVILIALYGVYYFIKRKKI
ncbi:MAG: hypothetical protein ABIG99_00870 [Patescibacteria group bacterium]